MATMEINKKAPAFTLNNQEGKKISLKSFLGKKVILYFYPRALTPGCTVQAEGMRDSLKNLEKLNAVVLAVSPDSPEKLQKFEEKKNLNFNLLSDENHEVAEKYGVWGLKKFMGKEFMGILRTTYIINEEGKIEYIMDKVKTKDHHKDVLNYLKKK